MNCANPPVLTPVPENVSVFGIRTFKEVIKVKQDHMTVPYPI